MGWGKTYTAFQVAVSTLLEILGYGLKPQYVGYAVTGYVSTLLEILAIEKWLDSR